MNLKITIPAFLLAFISFQSFSQNLSNGLKAHFNFENNLLDVSGNNEHLTNLNGNPIYNLRDSNNYSLFLDGLSTITSISSFNNSAYTQSAVSLWVKTVNSTSIFQICLQGAGMGFGAYIEGNTGKFMGFFDASSSGAAKSVNPINDNQWHHIVMQNNGTVTLLYVDAILEGTVPDNLSVGSGTTNNKLYIGKSNQGQYVFKGALDELRIYNRLLTQIEIDSLYNKHKLVSIGEINETLDLPVSIYPNPTNEQITIDFKKKYSKIEIEITDILGQSILKTSFQSDQFSQINLTGESGIYFVRMVLDGKVRTQKVIKK
jgi:hypothetical protein